MMLSEPRCVSTKCPLRRKASPLANSTLDFQDPKASKSHLSEDSRGGACWIFFLLDVCFSLLLRLVSVGVDLQAVAMRQARLQRPKDDHGYMVFWKMAHEFELI